MEKIDFKDYPSTDTPINATNLNAIQNNVENVITPLETNVNTINSDITSLESDVSTLNTNMESANSDINELVSSVSAINTKLNYISQFENGAGAPTQSYFRCEGFQIVAGKNSYEVAAHTTLEEIVTFDIPFGETPHILVAFSNNTQNEKYQHVIPKAIHQTTTNFKMQIVNGADGALLPGIAWFAFGKPGS